MFRFERNGAEAWVGSLKKTGVVIFDPRAQLNIGRGEVRLFVWHQQRMGLFMSEVVRGRFQGGTEAPAMPEFETIALTYLNSRVRSPPVPI